MIRWFQDSSRYEAECRAWDEEHPVPGINRDESFRFRLRVHVPRWNGRPKVEEAMRRFREYQQNPEPLPCRFPSKDCEGCGPDGFCRFG